MKIIQQLLFGLVTLFLIMPAKIMAFDEPELEFQFAYRPMAFETLKENADKVSLVAPEPFIIDDKGIIHGEPEPRLLDLAERHDIKVMPQVKNLDAGAGLFSQEWASALLNDPKSVERAVESMVELCRKYDLYGIQIDLEAVHINDRDKLTEFYRKAATALHDEGYKISIAIVHRFEETGGANSYTRWMMENWRGSYDLKKLGEIGDFIKVMSYAQHTRRTTPGPSQGLPWLREVMEYCLQYVPPEKLSMGITMRGSRYYTTADPDRYHINARSFSESISREDAESLIDQYNGSLNWDDTQKVKYGYIERGGTFEWFFIDDDIRSLNAKLDLVREYEFGAVNMWIFGDEDPELWNRIQDFSYD